MENIIKNHKEEEPSSPARTAVHDRREAFYLMYIAFLARSYKISITYQEHIKNISRTYQEHIKNISRISHIYILKYSHSKIINKYILYRK